MKNELLTIPGVGPEIARKLNMLGIKTIADLKRKNPDTLYKQLCKKMGSTVDRCVLYVFRCAVYFAEEQNHVPKLLKWWNWKD